METLFRAALQSERVYFRDEGWNYYMPSKYSRRPGIKGRALVLQGWPTDDMVAITSAARTLLEAGDCNAVVLEIVMDEKVLAELNSLGWTNYYSILALTL